MHHPIAYILTACALLAATPLISAAGAAGGDELPPRWQVLVDAASATERPARAEQPKRPAGPRFPIDGAHDYGESGALFGASRGGRMHEGQDVFAPAGTALVAVRDGRVVEAGNDGGRGNFVAIHAPAVDRTYVYLHMNEPSRVAVGERVRAGRRVGSVGCTGSCWGEHLHFEIRKGSTPYGPATDPLPALKRWEAR